MLCLLAAFSCLVIPPDVTAQVHSTVRILIVSEMGLSAPGAFSAIQGIRSAVAERPDFQTEFYTETLETQFFSDEVSPQELLAWDLRKYRNLKLDAIVAVGPEPIKFLMASREGLFRDVPIVICCSSKEQAGWPQLDSRFTGTWIVIEPAKTLDAALRLLPGTRHVAVVGGNARFDKGIEGVFKSTLQPYAAKLDISYLFGLDMASLLDRVKHLPSHTVVLYTSIWQDGAGQQFVNATNALPMVAGAANAPVFGLSDTYLGRGIVGGYVVNYAVQGKIAGGIVVQVLQGKSPRDIPIANGPGEYVFDWRAMKRWGVDERNLPAGSVVLYRVPTIWEQYGRELAAGLAAMIALAVLSGYLLVERRRRMHAQEEQLQLTGRLINAQEDERRRLARELHDDFSQRLAVLAVTLERTAESVPELSPERQRLNELWSSASEIGADLHAISHRLHPSPLESLGLVAGLGSYCREFSDRNDVEVAFTHEDIPRTIESDTSLCLFRVLQEALRNIQKHSGARKATVRLERLDGRLHLSIADDGTGFDPRLLRRQEGLGVRSMQERLRIVGGSFEVHSELRNGTRVDAWAPIPAVRRTAAESDN